MKKTDSINPETQLPLSIAELIRHHTLRGVMVELQDQVKDIADEYHDMEYDQTKAQAWSHAATILELAVLCIKRLAL